MAPGSGFYTTPDRGRDEVRMAYVLEKDELRKAMRVLRAALDAYAAANASAPAN
jgi:aspartate aminotransferase